MDDQLDSPLSSVAYSAVEDVETYSVKREYMRKFRRAKVSTIFGIGWEAFVRLPKSTALALLEEAQKDVEEQNALVTSVINQNKQPGH